jgi:ribA/ribD-fused uncharacterized protein
MSKLVIPEFKGDYYFLSNFFYHDQHFTTADKPLVMPTAEHVFQAAKYRAMPGLSEDAKVSYVVKIAGLKTPSEARTEGKRVKGLDVAAWDEMKISVMREILLNKFSTPALEARLLGTGDAMLVEGNTWGDQFWGRYEKKGYNILGVLLMEIRGYFRLCNNKWPTMPKDIELPPF